MGENNYSHLLISYNKKYIIAYGIAVFLAYLFSYIFLPTPSINEIPLIFTAGVIVLSLTFATVTFYARYLDEETSWLFDRLPKIAFSIPEEDFRDRAKKVFHHITFLFLVLIPVVALLTATVFSSAFIVFSNNYQYSSLPVFLFLSTIGILLVWVITFIISTTPTNDTLTNLLKSIETSMNKGRKEIIPNLYQQIQDMLDKINDLEKKRDSRHISKEEFEKELKEIRTAVDLLKKRKDKLP